LFNEITVFRQSVLNTVYVLYPVKPKTYYVSKEVIKCTY
jgi:hypothetical protein